ncbi:alpha-ketoacid dehydrogenase subunit beta [Legionella qingyii]|uniref:2-oxoisovalerate dehydrogenase subunit beta n=1 Tax=Legionella qingyii TaxID=2184757 RepID=A0A317TZI6_9GAMM|nr:alpha-ketoacid dehydrogenase subunit beta [Legionella qingyii]PWY54355.1 alpha-ketoacid dehydrogenase subunit beta [Legionella qingyii]RUR24102.1 alpha-ketoacid dehydrogenase subunit beta [Legionella qingyii]RUR24297.1 alpha-ketoacid dehydrogenase subunit beta [Legionella qingyii]
MTTQLMTYREALQTAHRRALQRDPRVFLMGEDVGAYGGTYAVSKGLLQEFGPQRIRNTPLSENAFVGIGIGAALGGMRPIVEVMTINFSLLALDQIVNHAATFCHMSGGQLFMPLVIRMATGAGRQVAAQHSHSFEGWYAHIPGIKILTPATVEDALGMLLPALQDPNPVLICEHTTLYNLEEQVNSEIEEVSIDKAVIRRSGTDVTIIAYSAMVHKALKAAQELSEEGINAEVIDLRILRPLDTETIIASIIKTHRVVVVDEGWKSVSLSAEIITRVIENAFYDLDAPPIRVCTKEVPIPYPKHLEDAAIPQVPSIKEACKKVVGHHV